MKIKLNSIQCGIKRNLLALSLCFLGCSGESWASFFELIIYPGKDPLPSYRLTRGKLFIGDEKEPWTLGKMPAQRATMISKPCDALNQDTLCVDFQGREAVIPEGTCLESSGNIKIKSGGSFVNKGTLRLNNVFRSQKIIIDFVGDSPITDFSKGTFTNQGTIDAPGAHLYVEGFFRNHNQGVLETHALTVCSLQNMGQLSTQTVHTRGVFENSGNIQAKETITSKNNFTNSGKIHCKNLSIQSSYENKENGSTEIELNLSIRKDFGNFGTIHCNNLLIDNCFSNEGIIQVNNFFSVGKFATNLGHILCKNASFFSSKNSGHLVALGFIKVGNHFCSEKNSLTVSPGIYTEGPFENSGVIFSKTIKTGLTYQNQGSVYGENIKAHALFKNTGYTCASFITAEGHLENSGYLKTLILNTKNFSNKGKGFLELKNTDEMEKKNIFVYNFPTLDPQKILLEKVHPAQEIFSVKFWQNSEKEKLTPLQITEGVKQSFDVQKYFPPFPRLTEEEKESRVAQAKQVILGSVQEYFVFDFNWSVHRIIRQTVGNMILSHLIPTLNLDWLSEEEKVKFLETTVKNAFNKAKGEITLAFHEGFPAHKGHDDMIERMACDLGKKFQGFLGLPGFSLGSQYTELMIIKIIQDIIDANK